MAAELGPLRDVLALRALVERYARAVDDGDGPSLASVFTPDGHLVVYDGATSQPIPGSREFKGRDQLAQIPDATKALAPTTMHFIGNHVVDFDGDTARGVTYCTANHLLADGSNLALMIRYLDEYSRADGEWLIADRRVVVEWTETRQTDPAALYRDSLLARRGSDDAPGP
jgi:uncharacterized protein (TIGR02246 family)